MRFGGDGNKHNPCLTPTPPQRCARLHVKLCLFPTSPDNNYVYIHTLQIILWPFPNPPSYHFWLKFFKEILWLFPKVVFQTCFYVYFHMALSNLQFCDNYGYFHMSFYRDPKQRPIILYFSRIHLWCTINVSNGAKW